MESSAEHWEREAKDGMTSIIPTKQERDEAKQEAKAAQLLDTSAGDAKVRVEVDLTKALNSLAGVEEGGHKSEVVIACLKDELANVEAERASLLLELKASKGEVSFLHACAEKDSEDMVKDYQGSLEVSFAYSYG